MRFTDGRLLRRPVLLVLLVALVALTLAACSDDEPQGDEDEDVDVEATEPAEDDNGDDEPTEPAEDDNGDEDTSGVVLYGEAQEPSILNGLLIDGSTLSTATIFNTQFPGAYRVTPEFELEPALLEGEAEFTEDPFTVTYRIREDAVWSDGEPVTSEDFVFTYEAMVAEAWADQIVNHAAYALIEEVEVVDDKTVTFTFSQPWAAWQELFPNVLPAHVLEGEDLLTVMNTELPAVGSGPFVFDSWDVGTQLRMVRNDAYWGGEVDVEQLVIRYVPDVNTLTQQMLNGDIHMFAPQPQVEILDQLGSVSERVTYEVGLGPVWEHIDFNTLVDGLDRAYVRQAIALGIDREVLVEALVTPINPDAEVLQNPIFMANDERYEPYYDRWDHDPGAATTLLEENGCERGDDGIYVCDDTRLSFRIHTDSGNERRELAQQLIQSDLADIGIEIDIDNSEAAAFGDRLDIPENCDGLCDYDIAMFAWAGSTNPTDNRNVYSCDFEGDSPAPRPQNWTAWCDEEASDLMDQGVMAVDPSTQTDLWNQAAERMAAEVPIVPLFQLPMLLAWDESISGAQLNPTNQTHLWNADEWTLTD